MRWLSTKKKGPVQQREYPPPPPNNNKLEQLFGRVAVLLALLGLDKVAEVVDLHIKARAHGRARAPRHGGGAGSAIQALNHHAVLRRPQLHVLATLGHSGEAAAKGRARGRRHGQPGDAPHGWRGRVLALGRAVGAEPAPGGTPAGRVWQVLVHFGKALLLLLLLLLVVAVGAGAGGGGWVLGVVAERGSIAGAGGLEQWRAVQQGKEPQQKGHGKQRDKKIHPGRGRRVAAQFIVAKDAPKQRANHFLRERGKER